MDSSLRNTIFNITSEKEFEHLTLEIFSYQYQKNKVYRAFCEHLKRGPKNVSKSTDIPFLPIEFFKSHRVVTDNKDPELIFESSGTTGNETSKHTILDSNLYTKSFLTAFQTFYGNPQDYCILALLPSYLERQGSSLVFMVEKLIQQTQHPESGFHRYDHKALHQKLKHLEANKAKTILIGVSFALLDFAESYPHPLKHCTVMETGGMKGRRKELIRSELHLILSHAFGVDVIHSEYGMTELLSQAYSKGNGRFKTPPWMKILIRDTEDPLTYPIFNKTGGINIIDLANIDSCAFIATQDLGKANKDGSFEVLGRFDHSDVRGCNLMAL
ncbi:acyl transferase [Allomuricauda sp. SCSIO 65647]|uniref:LuxE/PaaK family acyltransferase n=1 Tax=Allomuricauda sp. SCSIO 65647 TaxID=2908843 RepID=UPI001F21F255|nr:acyl transferase [Muricauda sp. SCSIO 65647]UJH66197.1 acyl transferase [Muricauda sp. SCSIO 65647]